jgi:hypothetical protein
MSKSQSQSDIVIPAPQEGEASWPPHQAGIQISLRLPRPVLAKLTRLAKESVQTKSQYITKLLSRIPDRYLEKSPKPISERVVEEAIRKND